MKAIQALDLGQPAQASSRAAAGVAGVRVVSALRFLIALLLVGNLGRVPLWSTGVKTTPLLFNDVLLLAVLLAGTVAALRSRMLVLDVTAAFAVLFAALGGMSALLAVPRFGLSGVEFAVSIAYLLRWIAYFGVYLVVINFARREDALPIWETLQATVLAFAGFGILQSLFLPGFAQLVQPDAGWDVQGHRLVSTLLDPNFAGGLIAMVLLVQLGRMAFGIMPPVWQPLALLAALLLTISRSSLLGFLVGAMLIVVVRGLARKLAGFGVAILLLLLPFLPLLIEFAAGFGKFSIEGSAALRFVSWMRAVQVFADNPLIGIGFNTYGFVQEEYGWRAVAGADFTLDGGLLFVAVTTGLAGVALFSAMIASALLQCRRLWRERLRAAGERGMGLGVAAATLALVVHSFFLNSLLYPFLTEVLWILWGITVLLSRDPVAKPESERAPGAALAMP